MEAPKRRPANIPIIVRLSPEEALYLSVAADRARISRNKLIRILLAARIDMPLPPPMGSPPHKGL